MAFNIQRSRLDITGEIPCQLHVIVHSHFVTSSVPAKALQQRSNQQGQTYDHEQTAEDPHHSNRRLRSRYTVSRRRRHWPYSPMSFQVLDISYHLLAN